LPVVFLALCLPIARKIHTNSYQAIAGWLPTEVFQSMAGVAPSGDTVEARKTAAMYERAAKVYAERGWQSAIATMIEASRRPPCWFEADWSQTPVPTKYDRRYNEREATWKRIHAAYYQALYLPLNESHNPVPAAQAVDFHLAAVRVVDHLRQGQPTDVTIRTLRVESQVLERIVDWASNKKTPTDQIRAVLKELEEHFLLHPLDPSASFAADDRIVRDVVRGKTQPLILAETPIDNVYYLAFLANELPWERRRALAALTMISMQNYRDAEVVKKLVDGKQDYYYQAYLQDWIQPDPYRDDRATDAWVFKQPSAATSYLTRYEYQARVPVRELFEQVLETETARRAAIVRLALLLYHRDHDQYPVALSDLVPAYLPAIPKDPFTGNAKLLSYAPRGRDSWLAPFRNNLRDFPYDAPLVWSVGVESLQINYPGTVPGSRSLIFPLPK
jgi:hypothetical protein